MKPETTAALIDALECAIATIENTEGNPIDASDLKTILNDAKRDAAGASEGQEPVAWMRQYMSYPDSPEDAPGFMVTTFHQNAAFASKCPEENTPVYLHPSAEIAALRERIAGMEKEAIRSLIARHAEELEQNDYAYFELAYTRRTGWMAWICSNHRDDDPNRKVIACGQGDTPDEACDAAIAKEKS